MKEEQSDKNKELDAMLRAQFEAALHKLDSDGKQTRPAPSPAPRGLPSEGSMAADLRTGRIAGIAKDEVFVELGEREQGVIPLAEFDAPPKVGEEHEFTLVDLDGDLWILSLKDSKRFATWKTLTIGNWVQAKVVGTNAGGLTLKIGPLDAFMPISQIDPKPASELNAYLGQSMLCEVEADTGRNRVLLSRRKVIEMERSRARDKSLAALAVGRVVSGTVEKIEPFGAFITLSPGVTGLLHVSNLSHQRVRHPEDILKLGDKVEVKVLEITDGGRRIGLGMKQLQAHPWDDLSEHWKAGMQAQGKITRLAEFGAFVEIAPGIEGLLHVKEMGIARHLRPADSLKVGQSVGVRIVAVDLEQRRMSLSRLTARGDVIGSDADVDVRTEAPGVSIHHESSVPRSTTNLGDALRRALDKKKDP